MSKDGDLDGCEPEEDDVVTEDTDIDMLVLFPTGDESLESDWKELFN